jgi:hypothetical protein
MGRRCDSRPFSVLAQRKGKHQPPLIEGPSVAAVDDRVGEDLVNVRPVSSEGQVDVLGLGEVSVYQEENGLAAAPSRLALLDRVAPSRGEPLVAGDVGVRLVEPRAGKVSADEPDHRRADKPVAQPRRLPLHVEQPEVGNKIENVYRIKMLPPR